MPKEYTGIYGKKWHVYLRDKIVFLATSMKLIVLGLGTWMLMIGKITNTQWMYIALAAIGGRAVEYWFRKKTGQNNDE